MLFQYNMDFFHEVIQQIQGSFFIMNRVVHDCIRLVRLVEVRLSNLGYSFIR